MRDILFRAWDTARKEYLSRGEYLLAVQAGRRPKTTKTYLDVLDRPDVYKDRFIIEQHTGLSDKNKLEIFEGDIVKQYITYFGATTTQLKERTGYVAYLQQECGFVIVLENSDVRLGHRNTGSNYSADFALEVIGNIHDNPELLKDDTILDNCCGAKMEDKT